MNSVFSAFMSFIIAFFSYFGISVKTDVLPFPETDDFTPAVRFSVCSDTHIGSASDKKLGRIKDLFSYGYKISEEDKHYNNFDAAVFVGDCTNDGTDEQFEAFGNTVNSAAKEGTHVLAVAAKNHDGYAGKKHARSAISEITGNDPDFHVVINGFHFIGLSTTKTENLTYTPDQRIWLEKQLKAAAAEDPSKPIFVFHHEHVQETVYGSSLIDGWGKIYFKDILAKYPQVIDFSGHSHYPLNDPRSIWQGAFTCVGTGTMHYSEFTVDLKRSYHPDGSDNAAQCWIAEADANGRVRLRGLDVLTGEWLCEYLIEKPADILSYPYTPYNMKAHSLAPEFANGAEMTVEKTEDGKYSVTVPAAVSTDGKIIFMYRVAVFGSMGIKKSSDFLINNYWTVNTFDSITFNVEAKKGDRIEITAENAFGMSSAPLTAEIG